MGSDNSVAASEVLENLRMDATYSAQSYFEAAKAAEFWSRVIVFFPALVSAFAGVLSAVYAVKLGGAISAMSGAIAATASFMGSSKQVSSFRESARKYTALRHAAQLEISLLHSRTEQEREEVVRSLSDVRSKIVATDDPVPNRFFEKASRRIDSGVTSYAAASE